MDPDGLVFTSRFSFETELSQSPYVRLIVDPVTIEGRVCFFTQPLFLAFVLYFCHFLFTGQRSSVLMDQIFVFLERQLHCLPALVLCW